jgi:hypothetical protein
MYEKIRIRKIKMLSFVKYSLAKVVKEDEAGEVEFEEILYLAVNVYKQKTGLDDFCDKVSRTKNPQIDLSWSEDDSILEKILPKLIKKFF